MRNLVSSINLIYLVQIKNSDQILDHITPLEGVDPMIPKRFLRSEIKLGSSWDQVVKNRNLYFIRAVEVLSIFEIKLGSPTNK
jgi:hypothetical protein